MARSNDGCTGRLYEVEVLGQCAAPYRGYMQWREAITLVSKSQPHTKTPFAARLEREVSVLLGKPAAFFTAVRSVLDVKHGVDGFFEFSGIVVTFDLTLNPHKDVAKADLIIGKEDVENVAECARRIAREFRTRLARAAA